MRFSAIIPVYNKHETICEAVKSIFSQTLQEFEIIIVDDGSMKPIECSLGMLAKHPQLRLIRQENLGVSVARNTGIAHANGEYIVFLDADDLWLPNHLETLDKLIEQYHRPAMIVTSHKEIFDDGHIRDCSKYLGDCEQSFQTNDLFKMLVEKSGRVIHTNSVCLKKSAMEEKEIYFEPGAIRGEDTDVWFRMALCYPVVLTKTVTTVYRREYSTATKMTNHIQNWVFACRSEAYFVQLGINALLTESLRLFLDRYWLTSAREACVIGHKEEAMQFLNRVWKKRSAAYLATRLFAFLPPSIGGWVYRWFLKLKQGRR